MILCSPLDSNMCARKAAEYEQTRAYKILNNKIMAAVKLRALRHLHIADLEYLCNANNDLMTKGARDMFLLGFSAGYDQAKKELTKNDK